MMQDVNRAEPFFGGPLRGKRGMTKFSVGVIGAGRGMTLAELFDRLPEAEVVAVCETIEERRERGLKLCPKAKGFMEYEKMLREPLDVVVVASPPPSHAEHVCAALEAGCAVLSEVPAAHTLEGAQRIVDAVRKTGRFYMLGENCTYYGYIRAWERMLREGILGEVVHAEGEYVHDIRGITWMDGKGRYFNPRDVREDSDAKPTWRASYHPIRYITHSLGPLLRIMQDRCTTVSCLSSGPRTQPEVGSPDMEVAIFNTTRNAPIRQLCGFSVPKEPGGQWFSLYCTKGWVEWRRAPWDHPRMYLEGHEMTEPSRMSWNVGMRGGPLSGSGHGGIDGALVWDFLRALAEGKPSPIDVHTAMDYTLPGIYAAMSAERGGEQLRIPDTRTERLAG